MKRFTNHPEPWGQFVDVKINAADLVPQRPGKYFSTSIVMSSVTDCYQPLERKYRLTRQILERLILLQPALEYSPNLTWSHVISISSNGSKTSP
jgi:DNA repair photolyase